MDEDWRVRLSFDDEDASRSYAEQLEAMNVQREVAQRLGGRVVVSRDGSELFLYAASEDDARLAEQIARGELASDQWPAQLELARWHDQAEEWEPADKPLPETEEERVAERERLMRREDLETVDQGYADWEVRVELPTRAGARELAERLDREGVSCRRRWHYVLVGAADEDAAHEWADRLRRAAPRGSKVSVEGTFATVERHNPFAFFSALSGGP